MWAAAPLSYCPERCPPAHSRRRRRSPPRPLFGEEPNEDDPNRPGPRARSTSPRGEHQEELEPRRGTAFRRLRRRAYDGAAAAAQRWWARSGAYNNAARANSNDDGTYGERLLIPPDAAAPWRHLPLLLLFYPPRTVQAQVAAHTADDERRLSRGYCWNLLCLGLLFLFGVEELRRGVRWRRGRGGQSKGRR